MFDPILSLIFALLAFLGPVQVTSVPHGALSYAGQSAYGITTCTAGVPSIQLEADASAQEAAHELIHAAACQVDGTFLTGPSALDGAACQTLPADCPHSLVYWGLRNPETLQRALEARMPR